MTPEDEIRIRQLIEEAAEAGARRALSHVGLDDEHAGKDVSDLRTLIDGWRMVKRATVETVTKWMTLGLLGMLALGAYKQFGAGK